MGIGGGVKLKVSFLMVTGRCQIRTGLTPFKKMGYRVGGYIKGLFFLNFLYINEKPYRRGTFWTGFISAVLSTSNLCHCRTSILCHCRTSILCLGHQFCRIPIASKNPQSLKSTPRAPRPSAFCSVLVSLLSRRCLCLCLHIRKTIVCLFFPNICDHESCAKHLQAIIC